MIPTANKYADCPPYMINTSYPSVVWQSLKPCDQRKVSKISNSTERHKH